MSDTAHLSLAIVLAAALGGASPDAAAAQDPPDPPPPLVVRLDSGLSVETPDGSSKFQVGGLLQVDGRFDAGGAASPAADTFVLRRVRPIVQGRVSRIFEFRLMPDFGNGVTTLFDAYLDVKLSRAFWVRAGKDKTPLGYEQLLPDFAVVFPERTLVTNLVPNRDIGVQARGDLARGHISYVGGVFNGIPDGASGDLDANNAKDVAGRLTVRAGGLGVAIAGTAGREAGGLPTLKTTAQQAFFSYVAGAVADGTRVRVSPAVFVYSKQIGAFAEYVRSTQAVAKGAARGDITNTAWEFTGLLVVTGERATEQGVAAPARPFDPAKGAWGALQVAARYGSLTVDADAFALGLAAAGASRTAAAAGIDASWSPTATIRCLVSYERTVFDGGTTGPRKPEHAIVFRLQVNLQPSL